MTLKKRVDSIDSLRGVAILMVLLYHIHAWVPGLSKLPGWYLFPMSLGFSGVDFFFVLSGFSLYYAWVRQAEITETVDVKKYYWRRFWRIYPPYIIAFTIPWVPSFASTPHDALKEALWHVTLMHNYSEKYFYGANGPLWSIAVEAQFYLLFPLIIWMTKRWGVNRVVFFGVLLSLIYRFGVFLNFGDLTYRQVPKPYLQGFWLARIPNFLLGILLASRWINLPQSEKTKYPINLLFLVAGFITLLGTWVFVYYFRHSSMIIRELGFAMGYAMLGFAVLRGAIQYVMSARWLHFTGKISFSLYLIHAPIVLLLSNSYRKMLPEFAIWHGFLGMIVAILICYLAAFAFYRWIETPFFNKARTYH
jgi:peptidoglycan/LPS O-acetylase OafA/YrhL